jgi:hypothetical protein
MQAQQVRGISETKEDSDCYFENLLKDSQKISEKYQLRYLQGKIIIAVLICIFITLLIVSSKNLFFRSFFLYFCTFYTADAILKYISTLWRNELISSANKLFDYDNPKISGVLLHVIFAAPPKTHKVFVPKVTELLYALKQAHVSGFTTHQRQCLYDLVREPRWARQYPDLVAAAMTAMLDIGTDEGYKALLSAAHRPAKRKSDRWAQDAAKACLAQWGRK